MIAFGHNSKTELESLNAQAKDLEQRIDRNVAELWKHESNGGKADEEQLGGQEL